MVVELLAFIPGLLLLMLANYSEKKKHMRILTQVFLAMLAILVILDGMLIFMLEDLTMFESPSTYAYGMLLTGILSFLIFLKPIRQGISKFTDMEPDNWLHATALVFAVVMVGMSLTAALSTDLIEVAKGAGIDSITVVLQDAIFVFAAFFGVGWLVRRDFKGALKRLGLVRPSLKDIVLSIGFTAVLLIVVMLISLIIQLVDPSSPLNGEDPTVAMLGGVTVLTAIIFSIGAGVGEELLFRGAMQPRFGIILTSVIFAAVHVQYLDPLSMVMLFSISLVFGYQRKMLNTTSCIITHTLYDLVLFLMVALA